MLPAPISTWEIRNGYVLNPRAPRNGVRPRRDGYRCTKCRQAGHTRRTCGMTPEERRRRAAGLKPIAA
jgi:hypothetical protein